MLDHHIVYTNGQLDNPATGVLDHEDQGMMQNVAIVLPGGSPITAGADGHEEAR